MCLPITAARAIAKTSCFPQHEAFEVTSSRHTARHPMLIFQGPGDHRPARTALDRGPSFKFGRCQLSQTASATPHLQQLDQHHQIDSIVCIQQTRASARTTQPLLVAAPLHQCFPVLWKYLATSARAVRLMLGTLFGALLFGEVPRGRLGIATLQPWEQQTLQLLWDCRFAWHSHDLTWRSFVHKRAPLQPASVMHNGPTCISEACTACWPVLSVAWSFVQTIVTSQSLAAHGHLKKPHHCLLRHLNPFHRLPTQLFNWKQQLIAGARQASQKHLGSLCSQPSSLPCPWRP